MTMTGWRMMSLTECMAREESPVRTRLAWFTDSLKRVTQSEVHFIKVTVKCSW